MLLKRQLDDLADQNPDRLTLLVGRLTLFPVFFVIVLLISTGADIFASPFGCLLRLTFLRFVVPLLLCMFPVHGVAPGRLVAAPQGPRHG